MDIYLLFCLSSIGLLFCASPALPVAVNECALDTDNCTQICNDTDDGFRCDCHPGFQLLSDNITCVEIDECAEEVEPCPPSQICNDKIGGFECLCPDQFQPTVNGTDCEDIDECAPGRNVCPQNCTNTVGSYHCSCFPGFQPSAKHSCEGPPQFMEEPMDQLPAVEGSNVTLICHAVAGPLHNVTWYFTNATNFTVEIGSTNTSTLDGFAINSETVMALNGELRPAQFSEYGSLTIFGVQYDDRGIYKCRVENCLGSNESSAIVAVQVPPSVISTSPQTDFNIGNASVSINCTIRGFPLSSVVWNKDGMEIPPASGIMITMYRIRDETTEYPFHTNSSQIVPPEELEYFDAVSFLTFNRSVNRDDAGNYTCTAISVVGESMLNVTSESIPVLILDVPNAPGNVAVSENGTRHQIVTWDTPFDGNSPITGYQVFISSDRNSTILQIFPPSGMPQATLITNTRINVTDLIPFVTYQYAVSARNNIGIGNLSALSDGVRTNPEAPDEPPVNCNLTSTSSTTITARWGPPDPPNGIIMDYAIQYRPVAAVADYDPSVLENVTMNTTGSDVREFEAGGLQEAVRYMVEISAINQVGEGPAVTCSILTDEDVPGRPENVTGFSPSSVSIVVSWDPPIPRDQNGVIVNYTVVSQRGGVMNMTSTNNNNTMLTLTGLDGFAEYNITVTAYTAAGAGTPSPAITVQTLDKVPPILVLSVSAVLETQVSVSVTADFRVGPCPDNITVYTVSASSDSSDGNDIHDVQMTFSSIPEGEILSGLRPFTTYHILAVGRTQSGAFVHSNPKTVTTLPFVPEAELEFELQGTSTDCNTGIVRWSENNATISTIIINYNRMGSVTSSQVMLTPSSSPSTVVLNVTSSGSGRAMYDFQVQLVSSDGRAGNSSSFTFECSGSAPLAKSIMTVVLCVVMAMMTAAFI